MKLRILMFLFLLFVPLKELLSQSPESFKYQAIIRNTRGELLIDKEVNLRISILKTTTTGQAVYSETHHQTTNDYGLVNLNIGQGLSADDFSAIDWGIDNYFIKVEMAQGRNPVYKEIGTTQLLSVPYALYAKTAGKVADSLSIDKDSDPTNELQNFSVTQTGDALRLSKGNGVILPGLSNANNYLTVTDIDGNIYQTAVIGNQIWMKQNLRTSRYNNGVPILHIPDIEDMHALWEPGYYWYNNDSASYEKPYGKLYNFYAVSAIWNINKNICPSGWHVPSEEEWKTMINYIGGSDVAGGKLKETGAMHWIEPNDGATNETGFTALPGGSTIISSSIGIGDIGSWWSSTYYPPEMATMCSMHSNISKVFIGLEYTTIGLSVRCLKD